MPLDKLLEFKEKWLDVDDSGDDYENGGGVDDGDCDVDGDEEQHHLPSRSWPRCFDLLRK
mgnify:CR=1 FL=1